MKASNVLSMVGMAVVCGAAASAFAKPDLQKAEWSGIELTPVRVGVLNADGSFGGWVNVDQSERGVCNTASSPIYDGYFPDVGGADQDTPVGADTGGCAGIFGGGTAPSTRWYFGTAWQQFYYAVDFQNAAGGGGEIDHTSLAMNLFGTGDSNATTSLVVIFQQFEDMATACGTFPPNTGFTGGVVLDYGSAVGTNPGGYYVLTADLCGLGWTMNADGEGGMEIILASSFDTNGFYTPHSTDPGANFFGIQAMLWGTSNNGTGSGLPGDETDIQYDDDGGDASTACNGGLLDGAICTAECYSYIFGLCPEPIGTMYALWGVAGNPCDGNPSDMNGDNCLNGTDIGLFLSAYATERLVPPGTCIGCDADMNGDNTVNGIDVGLFLQNYSPCAGQGSGC